jgi:drug/metabolite transporter (DMT)-like permease
VKRGIFYAICAAVFYGMISMIAKLATEVSPITLIFFKSAIFIFFIFFKKNISWKVNNKKLLFFRIFFGFLNSACFYYAAKKLTLVADAVALSVIGNLFTPFILFFWDRIKIPKTVILAILIGFIGVLVILKPSFNYFNFAGIVGLISGISIGFINVIVSKLSKTESIENIIFHFFLGTLIISLFPTIYYWKNFENPIMWLYVSLIGIFSLFFQFCYVKACFYAPINRISVFFYLTIVFSGFFEWLIQGKVPDMLSILGVFLIITGGVLAYGAKRKISVSQQIKI